MEKPSSVICLKCMMLIKHKKLKILTAAPVYVQNKYTQDLEEVYLALSWLFLSTSEYKFSGHIVIMSTDLLRFLTSSTAVCLLRK